jgi:hypothetical protein
MQHVITDGRNAQFAVEHGKTSLSKKYCQMAGPLDNTPASAATLAPRGIDVCLTRESGVSHAASLSFKNSIGHLLEASHDGPEKGPTLTGANKYVKGKKVLYMTQSQSELNRASDV